MFVLLVLFGTYKLCSAVAFYLRVYAPTNIALDHLRSPRGLKWALPAALLLTPAYWGAGYAVTTLIENGGPGWLNLVSALCAWNGIKFGMLGIWTPILMVRAQGSRRRCDPREGEAHLDLAHAARVSPPGVFRQSDGTACFDRSTG